MASITTDGKTKRRAILFVAPDGTRPRVRLGRVTMKQAETAKRFIEDLVACKVTGDAPKNATAEWLAGLPDTIRRRVERAGLVEPQDRREHPTLSEWVRRYIEGRTDVKPGTRINLEQVENDLVGFFADKRLDTITPGDAEDFRIHLKARSLAEGTIRRRCKRAKQFFLAAMKRKLIAENPFADIPCGSYTDTTRYYFVGREEAQAVLDACPDAEWRLIFALCRFGGLRCPSELLRLTWADIDWANDRFTVHATKTEHHRDGGIRQVPIFPELAPHLTECFQQAEPGAEHVITRYRDSNANLRTQLHRIIVRAGLTPWPKTFQNLRSTCETELAERFPIHVACKWLGNSTQVANKHYLQTTDEHFARAVQEAAHFPAQYPPVSPGKALQSQEPKGEKAHVCRPIQNDATPCSSKRLHRLTPRRLELRLPG